MVSNQKPIKKQEVNANVNAKNLNAVNLEKEINQVITICKDLVKSNKNNLLKTKQNEIDKKPKKIPESCPKNPDVTLEKVAQDMTCILKDLKDHLYTFKGKRDSFSDVVPKLEESLQNSNKYVERNQSFFKKMSSNQYKSQGVKNTPNVTSIPPATKPVLDSYQSFKRNNNNNAKTNLYSTSTVNAGNRKNVADSFSNKNRSTFQLTDSKAKMNYRRSKSSFTKPKPNFSNHSNTGSIGNHKIKINSTTKSYKSGPIMRTPPIALKSSITSRNSAFTIIPSYTGSPLNTIQAEVQRAVIKKKIFTIKGTYPAVRQALLRRGWIERMHLTYIRTHEHYKNYSTCSLQQLADLLWNKNVAEHCRKLIMTKLLQKYQPDFYWSCNWEVFKECPDNIKLTKMNRFRRDLFSYTSKLGLCDANKKAVWFKIPGVSNFHHPRTYSLSKTGDTPGFIKDFNRSAAMSLLKWVVKNSITGEYKVLSPSGKVPIEVFDFAVNECYKFIKKAEHADIDKEIKEAFDYEWNEFLEYFYKTVHIGNHFKQEGEVTEIDMVRKANFILNKLSKHWPYLQMDGVMNIWILKPTTGSQGIGIHCCRTLQYILRTIKANPNRRYIIQKYIERPLLIYDTKFDIRQWFLISSSVPLTIWMYKQCYIRFSSQTYNLRKLHESIHLTNNSVQARYQKDNRDIALPDYNMWDTVRFKNYLSDIGYADAYDAIIYPGMKECLIAAVLMYQDKLDRRKNSFELYGADFMLTEDFKPWLLEINSNPALHSSTPVTAKLCPAVLEDTIKVVIDYDENMFASTGDFELVYKKHIQGELPNVEIQIKGKPVTNDYFFNPPLNEFQNFNDRAITQQNILRTDAADYVKYIGSGMRKTLEDLLEILKKEKQKRHERQNKSVTTILSFITDTKECQTDNELDEVKAISEPLINQPLAAMLHVQKDDLMSFKTDLAVIEEKMSKCMEKFETEKNSAKEPKPDIKEKTETLEEKPIPQSDNTSGNEPKPNIKENAETLKKPVLQSNNEAKVPKSDTKEKNEVLDKKPTIQSNTLTEPKDKFNLENAKKGESAVSTTGSTKPSSRPNSSELKLKPNNELENKSKNSNKEFDPNSNKKQKTELNDELKKNLVKKAIASERVHTIVGGSA